MTGRFYLKLTTNGNLFGEFSNENTQSILTESATRIKPGEVGFIGEYVSTWHEIAVNKAELTMLTITPKLNCHNIYTLVWHKYLSEVSPETICFQGEGMLCDDLLIGDYKDLK